MAIWGPSYGSDLNSDSFLNVCVSFGEGVHEEGSLVGWMFQLLLCPAVGLERVGGLRVGAADPGPAWCWLQVTPPPLSLPSPLCSGHTVEEVDNTVTLIILAVVGGVIGLLIFILLLKKFITFVLKKTREKK